MPSPSASSQEVEIPAGTHLTSCSDELTSKPHAGRVSIRDLLRGVKQNDGSHFEIERLQEIKAARLPKEGSDSATRAVDSPRTAGPEDPPQSRRKSLAPALLRQSRTRNRLRLSSRQAGLQLQVSVYSQLESSPGKPKQLYPQEIKTVRHRGAHAKSLQASATTGAPDESEGLAGTEPGEIQSVFQRVFSVNDFVDEKSTQWRKRMLRKVRRGQCSSLYVQNDRVLPTTGATGQDDSRCYEKHDGDIIIAAARSESSLQRIVRPTSKPGEEQAPTYGSTGRVFGTPARLPGW